MGYCTIERARWIARHVVPLEPQLRAWLQRVRPVGVEIDDLIQEAYAKVAALPSVAHITQPRPYLFRVVKSLILEHVRHAQLIPIKSMTDLNELQLVEEAYPERIWSARQQLERVAKAIERLPGGCREAFLLRKFGDLTQKEVATQLQVSESTVEKQLARALRLLHSMIAAENQETPVSTERREDAKAGV